MNVERLHSIVRALRQDLDVGSIVPRMTELRNAVQAQISEPTNASYQEQIVSLRGSLNNALSISRSNDFPPTWHQAIETMGIDGLLGNKLLAQVNEIFNRNQITPVVALSDLTALTDRLDALNAAVNQLLGGLQFLRIPNEDLDPGEAEVGVLVPRAAVDNELKKLGDEFADLQRILAPFNELAGNSAPLKVASIASSDFGVYVEMIPGAAALLAVGVERILAAYKTVLELRVLRAQLRTQGMPEESLGSIDDHANGVMGAANRETAEVLAARAPADITQERRNELRNAAEKSLNAIAVRVDRGYNVDVRSGEPVPDVPDSATAVAEIRAAAPNLQYINLSGTPILLLAMPGLDEASAEANAE